MHQNLGLPIFINGRFLSRQPTGVDRVGYELVMAIDRLLIAGHPSVSGRRWVLLVPPDPVRLPALQHVECHVVGPFKGNLWEQLTLVWHSRGGLLVNLCNTFPLLKRRSAVMIHDVATRRVPQSYSKAFRLWYRVMMYWAMNHARLVLTVSQFSRGELTSFYGQRDIVVMPQGTDHFAALLADPSVLAAHHLSNRPFVLAVGSLAPHKNFATLIKAVEKIKSSGFDLVIAGGTNPKVFAESGQSLPHWVKYVGFVTDEQLKSLYQAAAAFVFPSIYEGYGLPPVEAMANGCPVICSRSASIPEACGSAAVYFDAGNPENIAQTVLNTLNDPHKLSDMRAAGFERTQPMTWDKAALELCFNLTRIKG
ncbi:MAG: glycosyltransferase family 1 protein [Rubrivivax sp.]|nr:MAG: glycosyltransferase family 1 protein [Rubrivivax sp.]